jgi:hypothetical protein
MKTTFHECGYDSLKVGATPIPAFGLVKHSTSGTIAPLAAITDIPLGAVSSAAQVAAATEAAEVALLNKQGTLKVVQAAAIVPGARVCCDATTFTSVRTTTGLSSVTVLVIGVKIDRQAIGNGAAGDVIEIIPCMPYTLAL